MTTGTDSSGRDIFVHLSAVRQAGLADLRKGQKVCFDIYYNRGKGTAKNLQLKPVIKVASGSAAPSAIFETGWAK
jgi:cold shock CspA family protein